MGLCPHARIIEGVTKCLGGGELFLNKIVLEDLQEKELSCCHLKGNMN